MDAPPPPAPRRAAFLLVGCTASGKTAVAHAIARESGALVLSADSMLVYRGMDVGTAKPTAEEMRGIPHHLIDVADPGEDFSVGR
jgi:tRNA dimethylallyltransferase